MTVEFTVGYGTQKRTIASLPCDVIPRKGERVFLPGHSGYEVVGVWHDFSSLKQAVIVRLE